MLFARGAPGKISFLEVQERMQGRLEKWFLSKRERVSNFRRKIRAWTGLAYPMTLTPEQEAARDDDNEFDTKPPDGLNKDFFALFQNYRGSSEKFGYDSTTHFRERHPTPLLTPIL